MLAHERVVFGELHVQGLDQRRDLAAGPADGEFGKCLEVAITVDERAQDGPAAGPVMSESTEESFIPVSSSSFSRRWAFCPRAVTSSV
ncbi:hypothetical protein [Streptomyces sp. NPDC001123]